MSIEVVQQKIVNSATLEPSKTASFDAPTTAGNSILFLVQVSNSSQRMVQPTVAGLSLVKGRDSASLDTGGWYSGIYVLHNAPSQQHINVSMPSTYTGMYTIVAYEISGASATIAPVTGEYYSTSYAPSFLVTLTPSAEIIANGGFLVHCAGASNGNANAFAPAQSEFEIQDVYPASGWNGWIAAKFTVEGVGGDVRSGATLVTGSRASSAVALFAAKGAESASTSYALFLGGD